MKIMKTAKTAKAKVFTKDQVYSIADTAFGVMILRESGDEWDRKSEQLRAHFNDLHELFLHNFSRMVHDQNFSVKDEHQLTVLLQELLAVRGMIDWK